MSAYSPYLVEESARRSSRTHPNGAALMLDQVIELYNRMRLRARIGRLWAALTRRPNTLEALAATGPAFARQGHARVESQTVPVEQIRGSEGRSRDFDRAFRPLQSGTKDRWVRLALASREGLALPPVELVQVGDRYFVRDGHHRVSVARALGQAYIEAEVTVWQAAGEAPSPERMFVGRLDRAPA